MTVAELYLLFGVKVDKDEFKGAEKAISGLRHRAAAFMSVMAAEKLAGFVEHVTEAATHTLGMSSALGISTQTVQEWNYVAQQAGSNINEFGIGIAMFERNLREFAAGRGSKRFKDSMRDVGLTSTDAKAALAGPDGVNAAIFKVSDAYLKMGNTGQRAAINTGLFGAKAKGMAQDLSVGSEALKARIKHLHDMGGVVDEKQLNDLKTLNNRISDVKTSLATMASQVVASLAPGFIKMVESATAWIVANKDLIEGTFAAAVEALGTAFSAVGDIITKIGELIHKALDGDDGAIAGLIFLGGLILSVVVPALYGMASAAFAAMAPFILIAGAVALVAYGVMQLRKHWDEVKTAGGEALDWVYDKLVAIGDWVNSIPKKIGDAFDSMYQSMKDGIVDALSHIADEIGQFAEDHPTMAKFMGLSGVAEDHRIHPYASAATVREIDQLEKGSDGYAATKAQQQLNTTRANVPSATGGNTVSIGPTTITINGVKDAGEVKEHLGDFHEQLMRDGAAALAATP